MSNSVSPSRLDKRTPAECDEEEEEVPLTLGRVWEFATESPVDELRFILETRRLNMAAAERSFAGEYGHCVGRTLRCDREIGRASCRERV